MVDLQIMSEFDEKIHDKAWRKSFLANPKQVLQADGHTIPPGYEIVVKMNTKDTYYISMPSISQEFNLDSISQINAAAEKGNTVSTAGTGGTLGSFSTAGTVTGSGSSFLCVSSAGSVGTAGSVKA